jgi:hypothetical protein
MAEAFASTVFPVSPGTVWALLREFNALPSWHPAIKASRLEPPEAAHTGVIRHLTLGDGSTVSERLVAVDDAARATSYEFTDSPFPVRRYTATIQVLPVSDTGGSFVSWRAVFDCDGADEADLARFFAADVFAAGLSALHQHLASAPQPTGAQQR